VFFSISPSLEVCFPRGVQVHMLVPIFKMPYNRDLEYHRSISSKRLSSLTFAFFKYKSHPDESKPNMVRFPRSPAMRQSEWLITIPHGCQETSDVVGRNYTVNKKMTSKGSDLAGKVRYLTVDC